MFSINLKIPLSGEKMYLEVILSHRIMKFQYVVLTKSCLWWLPKNIMFCFTQESSPINEVILIKNDE